MWKRKPTEFIDCESGKQYRRDELADKAYLVKRTNRNIDGYVIAEQKFIQIYANQKKLW